MLDLTKIREIARREGGVSRRMFLACGATLATLPAIGMRAEASPRRRRGFASNPFTLGVASGDPASDGVALWTRLAPKPLEPGGGLSPESIEVTWEVARDEMMKDVVKRGSAIATPQLGHSVHVEADGLEPDRWYFYRFRSGDAESRIGRTRTLPLATANPDRLRFAFASCQHYEAGLFTAYEHMAKDELDLVVHLGDYIYEREGMDGKVRKHVGKEIESLDDYRVRHAQYRSDAHLQAMHERCPWFVTWDDHELDNNYANGISEKKDEDPASFLQRRVNAYQAYYEAMPLRKRSLPSGPHMRLYRKASFGRLAELMVLDTRQFRSDQPNGDKASDINEAALDPKNTMLGAEQLDWLKASLIGSEGTWNVLAQQVMMGMVDRAAGDDHRYSMDQWPGYVHERMEVAQFLADRRVPNPIVLTGDIHTNWVNDLRVDDRRTDLPVIATEFVGTSISSGGNGLKEPKAMATILAENPGVKLFNAQRGYVRCEVTADRWTSDYIVVEEVTKPGAPAVKLASFAVEAGKPGVHPV